MYIKIFEIVLSEAREMSGLSLRKLAELCGLTRWRINRLELGTVRPRPEERRALAAVLTSHTHALLNAPTRPRRYKQRLKNRGLRYLSSLEPFYPPRDRVSRKRFGAALHSYPKEMRALNALVAKHPRFEEVNTFCEDVSLDSALECLFLNSLFAEGAVPLVVPPYALSPRLEQPVVCPQKKTEVGFRPFPCVELRNALYIPQVTFTTPKTFAVDFLRYLNGKWTAIELDGRGHNSGRDAEKEQALAVPVLRFNEEKVLEHVWGVLGKHDLGWAA